MSINKFMQELVSSSKVYNANFQVGEKPVAVSVRVDFDGEYDITWQFEEIGEYTDEELDEIDNFINNNY